MAKRYDLIVFEFIRMYESVDICFFFDRLI